MECLLEISIHAPVKGATHVASGSAAVNADFNPRTREGCDGYVLPTDVKKQLFQSTHP